MSGSLHHDGPTDVTTLAMPGARLIVIEAPELAGLPSVCRRRLIAAPRRLSRLAPEWIAECGARAIVFALFATQPDAWQIGGHLTRIDFDGRVIALSPALPNRRMVERELRAGYPDLRLSVMPVLRG